MFLMLKTKCIKAPIESDDGFRVSIMSRHTLSDGITVDPEISGGLYSAWWPVLAPPAGLIGAYYKRGLKWADFEAGYNQHLKASEAVDAIINLSNLALRSTVTVLCIEETPEFCHRRLLAEKCQRMTSAIVINIK